jgi:hypothetical protein
MPAGHYPEVPADFGHWLAGFIDGEGAFMIEARRRGSYKVAFKLGLRKDDGPILDQCAAVTGLGRVKRYARRAAIIAPGGKPLKAQPYAEWIVETKSDCQRLVALLDRFPLRAKKARDFAIWRLAIKEHARVRMHGPRGGVPGVRGPRPHDWSRFIELARQLKAVREYREDESELVLPETDDPEQLWTE